MIKDKKLLSFWKENLFAEFENSIYWDALPEKHRARVGLNDLVLNDSNLPERWIKQLLDTSALGLEVNPVPSIARKIKNLQFKNTIFEQETGAKGLGLGYPLFIQKDKTDPHKYIAAPLFIWQLELIQQKDTPDSWILRRAVGAPVFSNNILLYYLKTTYGIDIYDKMFSATHDGKVRQLELMKIVNELALLLDFSGSSNNIRVEPCPTQDTLPEFLEDNGAIRWSGVLGMYPNMGSNMLNLLDDLITQPEETEPESIPSYRQHNFGALPMNAGQSAVLRGLENNRQIVVEGAKGTGKTYTAAAIISNALANRAKTLVVAPNKVHLQQLKNLLSSLELGDLAYMLLDPSSEKDKLTKALYHNFTATKRLPAFEEEDYLQLLNQTIRLQNKLDKAYDAMSQPIFKGKNWTDLSGQFLENHLKEGKQLLNSQLFNKNYAFDEAEYDELKPNVIQGSTLYSELNTLKHPLRVLKTDIFSTKDFDTAHSFTHETLEDTLKKVNDLYYKFVMHLEGYGDRLETVYGNYYTFLKEKSSSIKEDIADYHERYGDDFNKSGAFRNFRLKVTGVFSKRNINVLDAKNKVFQEFVDLQGNYENKRYFTHVFSKIRGLSFDKVVTSLNNFEQSLEEWKASIPTLIHNELQRLQLGKSHPDIDYDHKIKELNSDFEAILLDINSAGLYQKSFDSDADTLIKKRMYLEDVTEQLETLQYNLRDFDNYYNWTNFWLALSHKDQDLLKALIKTKPNNWEAAFNSWYMHNLLNNHYSTDVLQSDALLKDFNDSHDQLKDFLIKKSQKYAKFHQSSEIRRLKKENKLLHSTLFGKTRDKLLEGIQPTQVLTTDFNLIQSMFPVLMTTPALVSEYLPQHKGLFDLVIVLGAESIQAEEAVSALWRGNHEVIFGDNQLGNIRNAASLLTAVGQTNYKQFKLNQIDDFNDGKLLNFRNAAFYNNQLQILPQVKRTYADSMKVIDTDGVYIDDERINKEEAEQIMHQLNNITPKENGYYPTIGIACFTLEQRDLLLQYINQIKQHKVAGNEKIALLEEAGLFIHHVNSLHAYQFDVLIVSTTYGQDSKGLFPPDITQLNEIEGLQALNNLTSCASRKVIICTSIPENVIAHYAAYSSTARGLNILTSYVAYARAVEANNKEQQQEILNNLLVAGKDIHEDINNTNPDNFVNVAMAALEPYFGEGRIEAHKDLDGLEIDLVVNPLYPEQPPMAVQCDGFFWRFSKGAYAWDRVLQKQLKSMGYEYMPIWSVDWWKNPNLAGKKLAGHFIQFDEQFAPPTISEEIEEEEPQPIPKYIQEPIEEEEGEESQITEDENIIMDSGEASSDKVE